MNGVLSIGYNPTFNDEQTKRFVEIYLLDFNDDIYGQSVILEWRKYLSDELKFDHIDDLIQQIKQDEQDAINYFNQDKLKCLFIYHLVKILDNDFNNLDLQIYEKSSIL